mmetsp:Transcript_6914/g.26690  ORF Transcript_6914/g.26690 Transcript_6914/m.26690 type:complete len:241 (-) Transcript_6914:32-754(-)
MRVIWWTLPALCAGFALEKPLVSVRDLGVNYRGKADAALQDVNLDIHSGIHIVVGLSGAGKTTLLRALSGQIPSSGQVRLAENTRLCLTDSELRRSRKSFRQLLAQRGVSAEEMLGDLCLNDNAAAALDQPMRDAPLSLGAYFAICVTCVEALEQSEDMRIVAILDEYVDKDDTRVSAAFWKQLQLLTRTHWPRVSVLAVTHQLDTARRFADSAIFLARGSLLQHVPPEALLYDGKNVGR